MKFKEEKGSIAIYVLILLLFMSGFLIITYAGNVNKSKIVKEQFNMVSEIYTYSGNDEEVYDKAYTDLRNKNAKLISISRENASVIELTKTFNENIKNYRIYGNANGLGTLINNEDDLNNGKYKISIKLTNANNESLTKDIYIDEPLYENDYIDYKTKEVVKDTQSQSIELPELSTFEDYTKIEIITENYPSKIELEYKGYTLE